MALTMRACLMRYAYQAYENRAMYSIFMIL